MEEGQGEGDGESGRDMFFVARGEVELYYKHPLEGHETVFAVLGEGATFGQLAFFTGLPRRLSARSKSFSTLIRVPHRQFLEIIRLKVTTCDYEKYCYLKDRVVYAREFECLEMRCHVCLSVAHLADACPMVHYAPSRSLLLRTAFVGSDQARAKSAEHRRRAKRANSLMLKPRLDAAHQARRAEINRLVRSQSEDEGLDDDLRDESGSGSDDDLSPLADSELIDASEGADNVQQVKSIRPFALNDRSLRLSRLVSNLQQSQLVSPEAFAREFGRKSVRPKTRPPYDGRTAQQPGHPRAALARAAEPEHSAQRALSQLLSGGAGTLGSESKKRSEQRTEQRAGAPPVSTQLADVVAERDALLADKQRVYAFYFPEGNYECVIQRYNLFHLRHRIRVKGAKKLRKSAKAGSLHAKGSTRHLRSGLFAKP